MAFEARYEGAVETVAYGGQGVTRLDGCVVFVPGVLPGERIRFRITSGHRAYAQGELLDVLEPSPDRIVSECPLMVRPRGRGPEAVPVCPGCAYGHACYKRELELKQAQFEECLARIGGLEDAVCRKPLAAPSPLHYRNKITLHTQKDGRETLFGYMGLDNHTVLDIPACPLAVPPLDDLLRSLRAKPGFFETLRNGMEVTLRWTPRDGALYWRGTPGPKEPWLLEETAAGPLLVPRGSFSQVNPGGAALLVETVLALMQKAAPARVADLYCGAGLFSMAAARAGIETGIGLDVDPAAIAAAVQNASRQNLDRFEFRAGIVEREIGSVLAEGEPASTLLLVDPPRTGLHPAVVGAIAAFRPKDVIYVSCAPDTLARDLARLAGAGYRPRHLQLADLFPRTAHFEALAWLRLPAKGRAAAAKKKPRAKAKKA